MSKKLFKKGYKPALDERLSLSRVVLHHKILLLKKLLVKY